MLSNLAPGIPLGCKALGAAIGASGDKAVCEDLSPIFVGDTDPILLPPSEGNRLIRQRGGGSERARRVDDTCGDHVVALHFLDKVGLHQCFQEPLPPWLD